MSTTFAKRTLQQAQNDAITFRAMFDGCFLQWEFAGSIRRRKLEVADVEHVIIPKVADIPGPGLFSEPVSTNFILRRLDELVAQGKLTKHMYGTAGFRWGTKYRGVDYKGFNHELFLAETGNWGGTLAIRTGSADFSRQLVTGLLRQGRRNYEGHVWRCDPCGFMNCEKSCPQCQGTQLVPVEPIPAPDERTYFELCGVKYREPENRL